MNIGDAISKIISSITGSITRQAGSKINSSVDSTVHKATNRAASSVTKTVGGAISAATVNADDEIKKISFSRLPDGSYNLSYSNSRIQSLTRPEISLAKGKEKSKALSILSSLLVSKHPTFKTKKVADAVAEQIFTDIQKG